VTFVVYALIAVNVILTVVFINTTDGCLQRDINIVVAVVVNIFVVVTVLLYVVFINNACGCSKVGDCS
jgi:hypothetical protein